MNATASLTSTAILRAIGATSMSDHVTRYFARVDERLSELPNDVCRRGFLGDELAKWQFRYDAFRLKVDRGEDTDPRVTAWDYVETLAELDKRMARYPAQVAA